MPDPQVLARSPITPTEPVGVVEGWEVATRRGEAAISAVDCTPLGKVLVRASATGAMSQRLGVAFGRAARTSHGVLVAGSGPDEWTCYAPPGAAKRLVEELRADGRDDELVSVLDITHGRALVRITGNSTADLLAKLCSIDLGEAVTPPGAAFRSSVAKVVTDVIRDDLDGVRSYLLGCERSFGGFLFGALLDAGAEFGIQVEGFVPPGP